MLPCTQMTYFDKSFNIIIQVIHVPQLLPLV